MAAPTNPTIAPAGHSVPTKTPVGCAQREQTKWHILCLEQGSALRNALFVLILRNPQSPCPQRHKEHCYPFAITIHHRQVAMEDFNLLFLVPYANLQLYN